MKKKFLMILMVAVLFSIILWISGALPLVHEFNIKLIKSVTALFS